MRTRETNQATARAGQPRGLRKWWFNQPLRKKGLIVVAAPLVALMGITAANLLLQQSRKPGTHRQPKRPCPGQLRPARSSSTR